MRTATPEIRRFYLTWEEITILQALGIKNPETDVIPDEILDQIEEAATREETEWGRETLMDLLEELEREMD